MDGIDRRRIDFGAQGVGKIVPPSPKRAAMKFMISFGNARIEHIAVGIMLPFVADRIFPIIEYLAAELVAANAPKRRTSCGAQMLMALSNRFDVERFKGDVKQRRRGSTENCDAMVVGWLCSTVEAEKRHSGRAVRKHLDVRGQKPEVSHIPVGNGREIRMLEHDVPEFENIRRRYGGPHRLIDASLSKGGVERNDAVARREPFNRRRAMGDVDVQAGWIRQSDAAAAPWRVGGLDRLAGRRAQHFKFVSTVNEDAKADEAVAIRGFDFRKEGGFALAAIVPDQTCMLDPDQPEIVQEAIHFTEVAAFECNICHRARTNYRLRAIKRNMEYPPVAGICVAHFFSPATVLMGR